MKFLQQGDYIGHTVKKLPKYAKINQHADFFRFLFTEDSLKIKKVPGTGYQATFFTEHFDKKFSFVIYKLARFHC